MNDKITFPRLAAMLADKSGRSKRFSEDFLREFFSIITERLENGDGVKIKGLGTFRLSRVEPRKSVDVTTGQPMEISGHSKVVFLPSKEFAESVNAPFEAFSAIEISDDIDISQLISKDEIDLQTPSDVSHLDSNIDSDRNILEENSPISNETPTESLTAALAENTQESDDPADETRNETLQEPNDNHGEVYDTTSEFVNPTDEETSSDNQEAETDDSEDDQEFIPTASRKRSWIKIATISLGAAIFALAATLTIWYVFATDNVNRIFRLHLTAAETTMQLTENDMAESMTESPEKASLINNAEAADTTADSAFINEDTEVPTAPSDELVYDTIGKTRYLTTMAKDHYGNFNLWPYIYEENKSKLGHPDRIRPGTPVVIPQLSKYGVDPANKEDVEKAKKMGVDIYARYGKKI
ncbi:MAG: HU family DNA-binding protein [Muribaculaceae bacterium]|nr:HU family DNA-binding protein [Muribaculaceae bacterium]